MDDKGNGNEYEHTTPVGVGQACILHGCRTCPADRKIHVSRQRPVACVATPEDRQRQREAREFSDLAGLIAGERHRASPKCGPAWEGIRLVGDAYRVTCWCGGLVNVAWSDVARRYINDGLVKAMKAQISGSGMAVRVASKEDLEKLRLWLIEHTGQLATATPEEISQVTARDSQHMADAAIYGATGGGPQRGRVEMDITPCWWTRGEEYQELAQAAAMIGAMRPLPAIHRLASERGKLIAVVDDGYDVGAIRAALRDAKPARTVRGELAEVRAERDAARRERDQFRDSNARFMSDDLPYAALRAWVLAIEGVEIVGEEDTEDRRAMHANLVTARLLLAKALLGAGAHDPGPDPAARVMRLGETETGRLMHVVLSQRQVERERAVRTDRQEMRDKPMDVTTGERLPRDVWSERVRAGLASRAAARGELVVCEPSEDVDDLL